MADHENRKILMDAKDFFKQQKSQGNTNFFLIMERYAEHKKDCCPEEFELLIRQQMEKVIKQLKKDILNLRQEIRDLSGWDEPENKNYNGEKIN